MMKNRLARRLAGVMRQELAAQDVEWEQARLTARYWDDPHAGPTLSCMHRARGVLGGIHLSSPVWEELDELRELLVAETGDGVMRYRITLDGHDADPVVDSFPDRGDDGTPDWAWPGEPDYQGQVYGPREIDKVDAPEYRRIAGSTGEVTDSLARIGAWLTANEPDYAAMLNPPATANDLDQLEQELDVVLPASVRQAWLTHNGQNGRGLLEFRWLPVAESTEKLGFFSSRADRGQGFIPILETDGIIGFVESVDQPGQDGPLWLYEHNDERLADSFGHYLAWFANQCEAGNITSQILDGMLVHTDLV